MVPFDVVTSGDCVISNSEGVTHLSKGCELLDLSVMQSSLCFADIEGITVPATGFVDNLRFLRAIVLIILNFALGYSLKKRS